MEIFKGLLMNQTVQKHRGRQLGQGRQMFGTRKTTAQADNPSRGSQQEISKLSLVLGAGRNWWAGGSQHLPHSCSSPESSAGQVAYHMCHPGFFAIEHIWLQGLALPTQGTEISLGSGRVGAEDSSVGIGNKWWWWVDNSCCNWAERDLKASALGFCRSSGMCYSLLSWLSVLHGHIFNSRKPILWRRRCHWVHVWPDCNVTDGIWPRLQQKNSGPKERIQRFTETPENRQTVQKHSGTQLDQGRKGFGTKKTRAQADNPLRRGQQKKCNWAISQKWANRNQGSKGWNLGEGLEAEMITGGTPSRRIRNWEIIQRNDGKAHMAKNNREKEWVCSSWFKKKAFWN